MTTNDTPIVSTTDSEPPQQKPPRRRLITSRCKPVRVLAVNEQIARQYHEPLGTTKPVQIGQVFPSAAIASEHLGFGFNAVSIRLAETKKFARLKGEPGPLRISLRGITLAYEQEGQ